MGADSAEEVIVVAVSEGRRPPTPQSYLEMLRERGLHEEADRMEVADRRPVYMVYQKRRSRSTQSSASGSQAAKTSTSVSGSG